jgi:hypothetical protein
MHAWIEGQAEHVSPPKKPEPATESIEVSDVDRELGRMGEPPRTAEEIDFDQFRVELALKPKSAETIVAERRARDEKARRDADPEIAKACAETTRRADATSTTRYKYPLIECQRCRRMVGQKTSWRKERGVRVSLASGKPLRHHCPHGYADGCRNAEGFNIDDGTILCPWCLAERRGETEPNTANVIDTTSAAHSAR